MNKLESDIIEVEHFLKDIKLSTPKFDEKANFSKIKSSYKQFHALLVWDLILDKERDKESEKILYFKECVSDISHAYFLNITSLYKSSRSSLRSGIENAIRVALIDRGVDINKIGAVFELFAEAKAAYREDGIARALLIKLHDIYTELCKSVHSSSANYLSLSVPFELLSKFEESQFVAENDRLRNVCSIVNQCAFWLWDEKLASAGHVNEDMVRDAIPRSIKRAKIS